MARDRLMTRKRFEAWLRGRPSTEVVGVRKCGGECPLASFLRDQGLEQPYVSNWYYQTGPGEMGLTLPKWGERVITGVDYGYQARDDEYARAAVTAKEVRRILRHG